MSFKEEFKSLLEELVLPEIQSIKTELSETNEKFDSVDQKTDTIKTGINELSEEIHRLDKTLNEGFTRLGDKIDEAQRKADKTSKSGRD